MLTRRLMMSTTAVGVALAASPLRAQISSVPDTDWPVYGGNLAYWRYKALDQINAANFNQLQVAWQFKTDNLGGRPEFILQCTPLLIAGRLFATAGRCLCGHRIAARRTGLLHCQRRFPEAAALPFPFALVHQFAGAAEVGYRAADFRRDRLHRYDRHRFGRRRSLRSALKRFSRWLVGKEDSAKHGTFTSTVGAV